MLLIIETQEYIRRKIGLQATTKIRIKWSIILTSACTCLTFSCKFVFISLFVGHIPLEIK